MPDFQFQWEFSSPVQSSDCIQLAVNAIDLLLYNIFITLWMEQLSQDVFKQVGAIARKRNMVTCSTLTVVQLIVLACEPKTFAQTLTAQTNIGVVIRRTLDVLNYMAPQKLLKLGWSKLGVISGTSYICSYGDSPITTGLYSEKL